MLQFRPVGKPVTANATPVLGQVPGQDLAVNNVWASTYAAVAGLRTVPQTKIVNQDGPISTSSDTLIDSRANTLTVTLGPASYSGQIIQVSLLYRRANYAYISCLKSGGGTFLLTPSAPSRRLIFVNGAWQAIESGYSSSSPDAAFVTTQQGPRLIGSDVERFGYRFGEAVGMSADGNTMVVIDGADNGNVGAVYVFVRSGTTWTQEGSKLVPNDIIPGEGYMYGLALSADGNTMTVGSMPDTGKQAQFWVFVRSGSTWSQQTAAIRQKGWMLGLSADGNTLASGDSSDNGNIGATYVFVRDGTTWTQQAKLVGTGYTGASYQGSSVSLSADGNTLAVAGPNDNSLGATWIFVRNDTSWSQQGTKLVPSDGTYNAISISLSANGNILATSSPNANSTEGAVWIFARVGITWTQQGNKLVSSSSIVSGQGSANTLSGDGFTLYVGAYDFINPQVGSTVVWLRTGDFQWVEAPYSPLRGYPLLDYDSQGTAVACSANGNTLAVGAPYNSDYGGVFIFS